MAELIPYRISDNRYYDPVTGRWPSRDPIEEVGGMDLSGSLQGAGGVGRLLSETAHGSQTTGHFYPTYDGNGNVIEYVDSTGLVQTHYEYDAFGNTLVASGDKANEFSHRFSTKPLDSETGLYYYGYRYYDPVTGRWPSRDPIGEYGGVNVYIMVLNNPVNLADMLGLISYRVESENASEPYGDSKSGTGGFLWSISWSVSYGMNYTNGGVVVYGTGSESRLTHTGVHSSAMVLYRCDDEGLIQQHTLDNGDSDSGGNLNVFASLDATISQDKKSAAVEFSSGATWGSPTSSGGPFGSGESGGNNGGSGRGSVTFKCVCVPDEPQ